MKHIKILINLMLSGAISVAIFALFLNYLGKKGHEINVSQIVDLLTSASLTMVFGYFILSFIGIWFRAKRFQLLISSDSNSPVPSMKNMYIITMIRNMVVDLLPSRTGELFYIGLVKKSDDVPTSTSASSLGMSIWFDLVILGLLIFGIAGFGVISGAFPVSLKWLFILIGVIVTFPVGLLIVSYWSNESKLASKIKHNFFVSWILNLLKTSLNSLKPSTFIKCSLLTFIIRSTKYLGMYLVFMAASEGVSEHFNDINPFEVLITLIASEFTASIPIPAIMSFGTYEAGGIASLSQIGIPLAIATVVMFTTHLLSQIIDYTIGGIGLILYWTQGLGQTQVNNGNDLSNSETNCPSKKGILKMATQFIVIGLIGLTALFWTYEGYQQYKTAKTLNAPQETGSISDDKSELYSSAKDNVTAMIGGDQSDGYIVWSSNRFGNHDILKMTLPEMEISQLTNHSHTEAYPRISPNGQYVAFVRAHVPWLSWRNFTDWDLYILDVNSGKETKLASNAYQPDWDNDGEHIYYIGDGGRGIRKININTLADEQVFITGQGDWPTKMALHTPSFNESSNNFALNYRKPMPIAGFLELDNNHNMNSVSKDSCQTVWAPDNSFAYYVGKGGKMTNAFYKFDYQTQTSEKWLDLPGDYSHEYFPKLSQNQKYLVFAASAGGHEHDTEDYELFIWKVGEPAENATRITYHTGNDNWPDIYIK